MPKSNVKCSSCDNQIKRWIINPVTKKPIKNFFCDNKCKGQWQIEQRESLGFTKEWLIDQYITQGKSANQIGREIGRDGHSVWNWMDAYGIPTRPRGYDISHLIQDGSTFRGKNHTDETKEKLRDARLKDGHVPYLKNGKHWMKSISRDKHPNWKGGITKDRQAVYASQEWCESVKKVWHRDKAICQRCGKNHNEEVNRGNFHIHHIVSFMVEEFRTEVKNLVLLCKECHKFVHSKKNINNEFIKGKNNEN